MKKIILADRATNAADLKKFLSDRSKEFSDIQIFEKQCVTTKPGAFDTVRYLFATWHMPVFTEAEIGRFFPSLEAIFYAAGNTSYFSEPFANRGIKIFSAQLENSIPVAEFVLAQILLANKGYFQAERKYRIGLWRLGYKRARQFSQSKPGNESAKVGIIGLGAVGTMLAQLLKPFDLEVVVHDPFVDVQRIRDLQATDVSLEKLFAECDVISNHLPDTQDTNRLLNYNHFSAMKHTATFINTGRGHQVDEKGLAKAMHECPSRTALLDVTRREPPNPFSALYSTKNIFLTPHIAGSQGNEINRLYSAALRNYSEFRQR